jgi:hypothetical protein
LADGVKVLTLVSPEFNFGEWVRVTVLESTLRILLQDILYLLGPVDYSILKKKGLVLTRSLLARCNIIRWKREKGSTLNLTNGYKGVSQIDMHFVHQILGDEVRPAHHVLWVTQDRHEYLIGDLVEIL